MPGLNALPYESQQLCSVESINIKVKDERDGAVPALLYLPHNAAPADNHENAAAILLSGAGGGVVDPSSIYLSMADKLASLSQAIPVMELDYRFPARNQYCVPDVLAGMEYLQQKHAISKSVLVG